jgi:hypothetical protein
MPVESREPINDSGFFRLKHTYIIAEQKKLHMEGFCRGPSPQNIPSDHSEMVTKSALAGRIQTMKFFSSLNHIEK